MIEALSALDGGLLLWIQAHRLPLLTAIMTFITHLGDAGIVWILLTAALLIPRRTRRAGMASACALLLSLLLVNLLIKPAVARVRPYEVIEGLKLLVAPETDFSFPSGHSSSSLAAAAALFRTLPRRAGVPLLILAVLICLSRLYVGVHYPSDVIAGALIGIFCGWLAAKIAPRLKL